jgi:hypothetical protein
MSVALPPRNKGQAGGFEQRMAKGPDGEGLFPVCETAVRALCAMCVFVSAARLT